MKSDEDTEYEAPHPILQAIIDAKKEGRDYITKEEFIESFQDDEQTGGFVADRMNKPQLKNRLEKEKSLSQKITNFFRGLIK